MRSAPLVVPLEGRTLLSAVAPGHAAAEAARALRAEVRADRAFVVSTYHNLLGSAPKPAAEAAWVHALESGMTRKQVKAAIMASPQYLKLRAQAAAANSGPGVFSEAYANGMALVGAYPGDGPGPWGYHNGYDQGSAIEGSSPGLGVVPSGYLYGYDNGTAVAGASPGTGAVPSGYLGGSF